MGKKNVYYEDPVFKERIFPPAFTTREDALKLAASTIKKINRRFITDHGESYRSVDMTDDEIASMWEVVGDLYDEPDEAPASAPSGKSTDDYYSDEDNFLK